MQDDNDGSNTQEKQAQDLSDEEYLKLIRENAMEGSTEDNDGGCPLEEDSPTTQDQPKEENQSVLVERTKDAATCLWNKICRPSPTNEVDQVDKETEAVSKLEREPDELQYGLKLPPHRNSKRVADKQCDIVWVDIDGLEDDVFTSSFNKEALNQRRKAEERICAQL
ncbi:hypothetical protein TELCIR_02189 [Teladorsagia circumcincta]|uniref:Uncharacterized protein n=1 Tax=Teladorsagia circumcincta TaxID=45464 RepID=A0A2G9UZU6_TELCI|nr:hypothetical protein TELCIR_02189 [Teladorsagia circumcincta]